jgi:LmbE family N-acetylglucosaminyl deacetylase
LEWMQAAAAMRPVMNRTDVDGAFVLTVALVIAPHPDDEVLGVGGTLLRHLAHGDEVHITICTKGEEQRFGKGQVERVQAEARAVHKFLGVSGSHFLDLPAAMLDTVPSADVNEVLKQVVDAVRPDTVYLPHPGDVHQDHRVIFQASMVCCRPLGDRYPTRILSYETVSETDWHAAPITPAFVPNVFVDISPYIERKLEACAMYASQIRPAPDQRSLEAIRALSVARGTAMNMPCAEAFMLIREITSDRQSAGSSRR